MRAFAMIVAFVLSITILAGCTQKSTTEEQASQTFTVTYKGADGKEHQNVLRGKEGRIGFIDGPFTYGNKTLPSSLLVGKPNKYMWHFWGKQEELVGKHKIVATHKETGTQIPLAQFTVNHLEPNNGADITAPSMLIFPKAGLWKVESFVDDKPFASFEIEAQGEEVLK